MASDKGKKILAVVTLSHFLNHLNLTSMSFIIPVFVAVALGLTPAEVGVVVATGSFTSGIFQIAFSFLMRRYPANILLAAGNGLMAAGGAYFGVATTLPTLIGARAVNGIGAAPQHPVGTSVIAESFEPSRRGGALGLSNGLTYFGNVLGPFIGLEFVLLWGWRAASVLLGSVMIIAVASVLLGIRTRAVQSDSKKEAESGFRSFLVALKDRDVLLVTLSSATIGTGGMGILTTFLPLFLIQEARLSNETTAIITTVFLLGGPIGSSLFGRLSDRWNRKHASMTAILMSGVAVSLLTFFRSPYALGAVFFLLGAFALAVGTVQQSYLSEISSAPIRDMAYGIFFTLNFSIGAIWTAIGGVLISVIGYNSTFGILALTTIPSALLVFATRQFKR